MSGMKVCDISLILEVCSGRYDRFQRDYKGTSALEEIGRKVLDIEELGTLGRGNGPCPYYLSREVATTSDIVFLPYNYLIEKKQREHLQVKFENSIVIFDEGHNIEVESHCQGLLYYPLLNCIEQPVTNDKLIMTICAVP